MAIARGSETITRITTRAKARCSAPPASPQALTRSPLRITGKNPAADATSYLVVDAIDAEGIPCLARFEETSPSFAFGANWWRLSFSIQSRPTSTLFPYTTLFRSFSFEGSSVRWIGETGPARAAGAVVIDGNSKGQRDNYAYYYTSQSAVFSATGLAPGAHTITITYYRQEPGG